MINFTANGEVELDEIKENVQISAAGGRKAD